MESSGDSRALVVGDQDATMTDIPEKGQPPGAPPDGSGSWVSKVVGTSAGGMQSPEKMLNDEFVSARLRVEFPNGEDGEPVITIGSEVLDAMNGLWKQCMIVKVLGRNISIAVLSRKLRELWKPRGAMHVMDLPRQFFMVRFEAEEEYLAALTGGPWRAFGSYLMVQAWAPEFDPLKNDIVTTPVWVRLSNIPVNFYHKSILMGIAKGLGKPVKVDLTTLNFERARFARVCVEVNLAKPLKGSVVINGERYYVSYEGLTNVCSHCGMYGHLIHACPALNPERTGVANVTEVGEASNSATQVEDGFTVVRRNNRRPTLAANQDVAVTGKPGGVMERSLKEIPVNKAKSNVFTSNRFGNLEEEITSGEIREVAKSQGANKENEFVPIQFGKGKNVEPSKEGVNAVSDKERGVGEKAGRGKGNMGLKGGPKGKWAGGIKPIGINGPKPNIQQNRPARGLVFGPVSGDNERSVSGKRLRVEQSGVGRPGGSFLNEATTTMALVHSVQSQNESTAVAHNELAEKSLTLFETHAGGDRARSICQGLGFEHSYRVDAVGQSGGLWLLWKTGIGDVVIVESAEQFIHAKVGEGTDVLHLIVVYAAPTVSRRSGLWAELSAVIGRIDEPLLIGGDFNTIVRLDERTGGNGRLSPDSLAFGDWMNEHSLIDMGFKGSKFTWRRGRMESTYVAKRLDRVLCCPHTRLKWQEASVHHLPFLSSDHVPLYVQLSPEVKRDPSRRPFRFEAAWLKHPSFKELLVTSWDREISTQQALVGLKEKLKKWNNEVFGHVQKRKNKLLVAIKEVQDLLEVGQTDELLSKEEGLIKEFDEVLEQEELIWFQKSREKWIAHGDRNTQYFHTSTIIRRRRNRIEMLKDDENKWVSEPKEIETLAVGYYKRLYSMDDVDLVVEQLPQFGFSALTREEVNDLNTPFSRLEVESAIKGMGKFKAPGPDGFQPVFYQQCWDVIGDSVTSFVLRFFETAELPSELNDALVVLIAKVTKPEKITQFRPISLCNVLFKTITKTMVMRLKKIMPKLIGPAQSSFIPGRLSADNIVVVQEAVHSMRRKKGRKGWMLLKLDLEKAYDRIRWDFLEDTLRAAGLPDTWVRWILKCVTGPSMNLLLNGEITEAFKPARGLRQGDPLSPYLFVLCMERLCHQIERSIESKEWKPISISQGGPKLSHICFADDLILFAEASVTQIRVIRKVLEKFCEASGQKVSLEKSKIFFSKNVHRDLEKLISEESGIQSTRDLGKYLGMPVLQKRINKETFGGVLERVTSRLSGWKSRTLSLAGRLTLTKAVISSIPVHSMSTISLPKSTLDSLDRISRSFLWGSSPEKRKQHLISWKKVCRPKKDGGLGIRLARDMNKALLAKIGWRLLHDDSSLWVRVLRSKYKVREVQNFAWGAVKSNWSSTWKSVAVGMREVVQPGLSWVIGDGQCIRFWSDRWLSDKPLREEVTGVLPEGYDAIRVRDMWTHGAGWKLHQIVPFVTERTRLKLGAVVVDFVTGAKDRVSWGDSEDGQFSVKSAYATLTRDNTPRQNLSKLFDCVWRVIAPERVKIFIWLGVHQVVMTNVERQRRHLADSGICQVCKGAEETIIHILRDCPAMAGIWRRIVPARRRRLFFQQSLLEWLYANLRDSVEMEGSSWSTVFAMGVWWGWKWRCGNVFGVNGKCRDRVKFIKELAKEVTAAHSTFSHPLQEGARIERQVAWLPPGDGWVKLNTDGASRGNPGLATAGGALRDEHGHWCGGFALNIGICSAPLAELWGVYYGLYLAWERRVTRVELEVDSKLVVGFLTTGISDSHPLSFLVRLCYGFLSRDWIVRISHVYREANRLADGLANYAFSLPLGFHALDTIPDVVNSIWLEDIAGTARPRQVRL
ncbi:Ribonuclease H domain [Arabidopsis thaliana x Arabidopsis arenosa]|uniref:Ribonuclease H domain n=1 Tax=Arabidopsis thaliana x Arabidopsis arenosa TaxID=1240361 RepID=A0A8T1YDN8_9BRAS|nr:Ribonuclease H domain [Arabidopsis thaliana x Arabidopsis arenosa]